MTGERFLRVLAWMVLPRRVQRVWIAVSIKVAIY